jgi:poly(A) polymerase
MLEQPRFRAACDFLQLRAAAGEFDSVLAQWWMDLANGDDATRAQMIDEASRAPRAKGEDVPPRRRRSRRRGSGGGGGDGGQVVVTHGHDE